MSDPTQTQEAATQQTLLDAYAALLDSASHMHELAVAGQWAELIEQRTGYIMLVDKLRRLDAIVTLDAEARESKAELLERILDYDARTRRQLIDRRDELGKLIDVSEQEQRLYRTYGPQQGHGDAFYTHHQGDAKRST
ncbi:flagellar protein FliT [Vreelandella jeotgali]|uniref:flagellar protein FliT n=1 Tax=Vreelandella jeotgali TaxID=553386 RepID=UPI0003680D6F|nr:flagellar protein FliT [Halomonas jeotgali]